MPPSSDWRYFWVGGERVTGGGKGTGGDISVLCSSDLSIEFPCPSVGVSRRGPMGDAESDDDSATREWDAFPGYA